jgi:hypothetical protein
MPIPCVWCPVPSESEDNMEKSLITGYFRSVFGNRAEIRVNSTHDAPYPEYGYVVHVRIRKGMYIECREYIAGVENGKVIRQLMHYVKGK